ncbi:hypothetical protein [Demequina sp.]|uniref:hypothetical protein n=1 Tax=Demequina sp. TaxID=2050685 RepID=UPI003D13081F
MPESDVPHTVSTHVAPKYVDIAYLPSAFRRDQGDPLRAVAFWNGQHQYEPPTETGALRLAEAIRAERIGALAALAPQLLGLARDSRPYVRAAAATCFSILAKAHQAPADREVWRAMLGLAKYDDDAEVRSAAERALVHFEHCGTFARAS